ncbi:MAG: hypothetical protein NC918_08775, partial [Candidatus Omnitrophica bacterium]|nr:hypothetical protein [Candidatus Omnitrophota bacterium]
YKKKRDALKKLSSFLNGTISKSFFLPTFIGEYQGLKFLIELIEGHKNSSSYLKISLFKNSFLKLSIYKESILTNLGKKIGLVHEVKTGDEIFDREFLIFSNNSTQAMLYLNNMDIKNAIKELFNNGFGAILINGKKILIQKPNYNLEKDLQQENLIGVLQKLNILARRL